MKNIHLCLLALIVLTLGGKAFGGAAWLEDFETAKTQASTQGKAILACFTGSDWCPYCIKLEKEVLGTDEFKKWAEKKVVLMMVDLPRHKTQKAEVKKQNKELIAHYGVRGFPRVIFLSADGEVLGTSGYNGKTPAQWTQNADLSIDPYLKKVSEDGSAAKSQAAAADAEKQKATEKAIAARREKLKSDGYRYWTDKSGRKIFAKLHAVKRRVAGLIDENGKQIAIKTSDLSEEDRDWIKANK